MEEYYGNTGSDYFNISVSPNTQLKQGDIAEVSIKVTVEKPYKKVLRGRYIFKVGQEKLTYRVVDKEYSPYFLVNITNTLPYYVVREAFDSHNINDRISVSTYRALSDINKEKCSSAEVKITFDPRRFFLDMTNVNYQKAINVTKENVDGHLHINSLTFKVDAVSSTSVRIYKRNVKEDNTFPNTTGIENPINLNVIR